MAHIELRHLSKRFGAQPVLRALDLVVPDGSFVALVGPSGCGKSTLLRLLAGLEDASEGDICIGGRRVNDLPPQERGVAMVFQSYALYPHMSAYDNMAFGLRRMGGLSAEALDHKVRDVAERLALTPLLDRLPKQLSGGQRQRVAIGRAIVRDPQVFLFDEPLSNLDAALRVQMRVELARLHKELGTTMVYVTHDQTEAMTLADQIVVLHEGQVQQVGAPLALYHRPANRFVAGFIGSPQMNFIPVTVEGVSDKMLRLRLRGGTGWGMDLPASTPAPPGAGTELTLGVRPEHLRVVASDGHAAAGSGGLHADVLVVEQLGDSHLLHLQTAWGETLTVRQADGAQVREGEAVQVQLPPAQCLLFDAEGQAL